MRGRKTSHFRVMLCLSDAQLSFQCILQHHGKVDALFLCHRVQPRGNGERLFDGAVVVELPIGHRVAADQRDQLVILHGQLVHIRGLRRRLAVFLHIVEHQAELDNNSKYYWRYTGYYSL